MVLSEVAAKLNLHNPPICADVLALARLGCVLAAAATGVQPFLVVDGVGGPRLFGCVDGFAFLSC
jgi:hypothetical protein